MITKIEFYQKPLKYIILEYIEKTFVSRDKKDHNYGAEKLIYMELMISQFKKKPRKAQISTTYCF